MNIDIKGVSIKLTQEQLDKVAKHLAKKEPKICPQNGEEYYYFANDGFIYNDIAIDSLGRLNSYRTEQEAKQARDIDFAKMRLKFAIEVANVGWTPEFIAGGGNYYFILYTGKIIIDSNGVIKLHPSWMYMKSREIAKQICISHKEDIKLILSE